MTISGVIESYQRWDEFHFYSDEDGTNGNYTESLASPGKRWKLAEVRVHFSTAFASVEDFTIRVSSLLGSNFNIKFASVAMNGVQDYILQLSQPYPLFSGDILVIAQSMKSAVNLFGLEVLGWAVRG